MAPPKQTDPQFKLRMPPELKEAIDVAAERNNRSMNAEMLARLSDSFGPPRDRLLATILEMAAELDEVGPTHVRLDPESIKLLDQIASERGISRNKALELVLRRAAHHITAETAVGKRILNAMDKLDPIE